MKDTTPKYGSVEDTEILDENGSKLITNKSYRAGKLVFPIRRRYTFRERVKDQKEEHNWYITFSDQLKQDKNMLDPEFKIDGSTVGEQNGFYYVVMSHTKLVYKHNE